MSDVRETLRQLVELTEQQGMSDLEALRFMADAVETIRREVVEAERQQRKEEAAGRPPVNVLLN